MSKIITKNQLDLVIESTLKEADYMMENKDELKLTKDHMDELHKEGHCMCDSKCLVYWEAVKDDDSKLKELMNKLAAEKTTCVMITKDQMDMLHNDGKCDCDNNVTLSYEDEMKEGDYMNHMEDDMKEGDYMKAEGDDSHDDSMKAEGEMTEEMCNECGGTMVEGICEGGCGSMKEEDMDEGNEFTGELNKAREEGKATFTVDGKTYKVEPADKEEKDNVKESVNKLTEALSETTNKEIMKEEIDFFNKMINYNKK